MNFRLYISSDLFKNIVTIDGQKYNVIDEAKEGYEAYQASDGRTLYRKLVGQGGTDTSGEGGEKKSPDGEKQPKVEEKDPLKQDQEPEKGPDLKGAAEAKQAQMESDPLLDNKPKEEAKGEPNKEGIQVFVTRDMHQQLADLGYSKDQRRSMKPEEAASVIKEGRTAGKKDPKLTLDDPDAPFAGQDEDKGPLHHYLEAKAADKLGDSKVAQEQREIARKKAEALDPVEHDDLKEKLVVQELHDDAKYHVQQRAAAVEAKARPVIEAGKQVSADRAQAQEVQNKKDDDGIRRKLEQKRKRELGTADTVQAEATDSKKTSPDTPAAKEEAPDSYEEFSGEDPNEVAQKYAENASHQAEARESAGRGQTQVSTDSLKQQQMSAQRAASEEFKRQDEEYTKQAEDAKKQQAEYEAKLDEHNAALESHTEEMGRLRERMDAVKQGKPVKDDKKLKKLKDDLTDLRNEKKRHNLDEAPDKAKFAEKLKKLESAAEKHQKTVDAHKKRHDKLKSKKSKPVVRKEGESDAAFERRASTAKERDRAHSAKLRWAEEKAGELDKKSKAHQANIKVHKDSFTADQESHKAAQGEFDKKVQGLSESHAAEKRRVESEFAPAKADFDKKHAEAKAAVDAHAKKKKGLPEKPKKPKAAKVKQTHKKPESDFEKRGHAEHRDSHSKAAANIESHLRQNPDLSDEQRRDLMKLHERHSYHSNLENVPTADQKKESRQLHSATKTQGADRHHDEVKAEREQKEAKVKEREDKEFQRKRQQAEKKIQKERENTPRPPENEMDRAAVKQHADQAGQALDNIQSHLEDGDLDDEDRKHLEEMAAKIQNHADLQTVPTKAETAELREVMKLTKQHSGKHYSETPEGKAAEEGGESSGKKETTRGTAGTSTGSNLARLYQAGQKARRIGSAAATAQGAGGLVEPALNAPGKTVTNAGHFLLGESKPETRSAQTPKDLEQTPEEAKEDSRMNRIAEKRAKVQDQSKTQKSLRLYLRNRA